MIDTDLLLQTLATAAVISVALITLLIIAAGIYFLVKLTAATGRLAAANLRRRRAARKDIYYRYNRTD